ncbi:hypothetical protein SCARD494_09511 [Seiridium cardinale]
MPSRTVPVTLRYATSPDTASDDVKVELRALLEELNDEYAELDDTNSLAIFEGWFAFVQTLVPIIGTTTIHVSAFAPLESTISINYDNESHTRAHCDHMTGRTVMLQDEQDIMNQMISFRNYATLLWWNLSEESQQLAASAIDYLIQEADRIIGGNTDEE